MLPEHRALLEDELCPVPDEMLGEMYRASAHGLNELIATVSPTAKVLLAVYCYRRAHLASIGLAIAATCDKDDLANWAGNAGVALFERSREAPNRRPLTPMRLAEKKLRWRLGLSGRSDRARVCRLIYWPAAFHFIIAAVSATETSAYSPVIRASACAFCPLATHSNTFAAHLWKSACSLQTDA